MREPPTVGADCDESKDHPTCINSTALGICGIDAKWVARSCARCDDFAPVLCTQRAGGACTGGQPFCVTPTSMLVCWDGRYRELECKECGRRPGETFDHCS